MYSLSASMVVPKRRVGRDKVVHEGYGYVYDKTSRSNPNISFWRCEKKGSCPARIHLECGEITKVINSHTHGDRHANAKHVQSILSIRDRSPVRDQPEGTYSVIERGDDAVSAAMCRLIENSPFASTARYSAGFQNAARYPSASTIGIKPEYPTMVESSGLIMGLGDVEQAQSSFAHGSNDDFPAENSRVRSPFNLTTGMNVEKSGVGNIVEGGLIMDVVNAEQARIAEAAGACAVIAYGKVAADPSNDEGVSRMSDPKLIKEIMAAVNIPVMAKVRIGHFGEAQIIQQLGVDMIDESEVLSIADEANHINKRSFKTPFVCGAKDLGEALRRISEGAAMIRTKSCIGTGNVVEAVRYARTIKQQIGYVKALDDDALYTYAKELRVPYDLLKETAKKGRLPVTYFAAGGLATPADVSLLMQLGVDGVFVGSGIFKSNCPEKRAKAMALAVTHYNDPKILAEIS